MVGNSSQNAGCVSLIFQFVWKGTTSGGTLARSLRTPGKTSRAPDRIPINETVMNENLGAYGGRVAASRIAQVAEWVVLLYQGAAGVLVTLLQGGASLLNDVCSMVHNSL
jgi:hypothetical protein